MSKPKTITLDPKEIAILEEAIGDKQTDVHRDIAWRRTQRDMEQQETLIEKADLLDKVKRKLQ